MRETALQDPAETTVAVLTQVLWVPGALDREESDAPVGRCEEKDALRPQDSSGLFQEKMGLGGVLDNLEAGDEIEGVIPERHPLGV